MESFIRKNKSGFIASVSFAALVIISLFIFGFEKLNPLPAEKMDGLIIDFSGEETDGSSAQSEIMTVQVAHTESSRQQNTANEPIMTQNLEESVVINTSEIQQQTENTEQNPLAFLDDLFSNTYKLPGTIDGTAKEPGIGESKDDKNIPNTNGNEIILKDRKVKELLKPQYKSGEQGKVVVEILVDRNGNVTKAKAGIKGTTTSDQGLWREAERAALKSTFSENANAVEFQHGSITYSFILH